MNTSNVRLTTLTDWQNRFQNRRRSSALRPPSLRMYNNFRLHQFLMNHLPAGWNGSVIEMGCAFSSWALYFAEMWNARYFGIDYLPEGASAASDAVEQAKQSREQVACCDFLSKDLPFGDSQFDLLISFGVIEHFSCPEECLTRFWQYLRPGGYMLTLIPNLYGANGFLLKTLFQDIWKSHTPISPEMLSIWSKYAKCHVLYNGYWGTLYPFVLPWSELEWAWPLKYPFIWSLRQADRLFSRILRSTSWKPESRLFSPYILNFAKKSSE